MNLKPVLIDFPRKRLIAQNPLMLHSYRLLSTNLASTVLSCDEHFAKHEE
jgi:hypothetical protein